MIKQTTYLCSSCKQSQTQNNKFYYIYSLNQPTCQKCYKKKFQQIFKYQGNRQLQPQIVKIQPNLYLGNADAASSFSIIKQYKIDSVCVCGFFLMTPFDQKQIQQGKKRYYNLNIQYKKLLIGDFAQQDIKQYFQDNNKWIQEKLKQGKVVLVHCLSGVSRSVSFILAYLIGKCGMSYNQAYNLVKKKREVIHPNEGFVKQLKQFQGIKRSQTK